MTDTHSLGPGGRSRVLLVAGALALLVGLVTAIVWFDLGISFTVGPRQLSVGTVIVGTVLVLVTIGTPVYLFSKWEAEQQRTGRTDGQNPSGDRDQ